MFIGNVQLVYVVLILLVFDLLALAGSNGGGHLAHLGGAFYGFIYIRQLQSGNDFGKPIEQAIDWIAGIFDKDRLKHHLKRQVVK